MSTNTVANANWPRTKERIRVICPHGFTDSLWNLDWLENGHSGDYVEIILAMKRAGFVTERGPEAGGLVTRYDSCPRCNATFDAKKNEALEFMRKAAGLNV